MKLRSFMRRFGTNEACRAHLESVRWPDGPVCDRCGCLNEAIPVEGRVGYGSVEMEPSTAFSTDRNDVVDRLKAKTCEACGDADSPVEVHHVRKLADMGDVTLFTFLKGARTRKRRVLCHPCHVAHHSGRLKARLDMLARQRVGREASVGAG